MGFEQIDLNQYPRKAHFEYFRSLAYPYVGTTVNVDVTELVRMCQEKEYSFYLTFLHAVALAADGVPEFRMRIHDGGIVRYDECPTSHTEPAGDGTYCYCTLHHHMPLAEYLERAQEARKTCRENGIQEDEDVESMLFISTLPWVHYTALIQPVAGRDESNPRITWGRYEVNDKGRCLLPVSVLVHHALADGVHIAAFYHNLEKQMEILSEEE